jgi:hypothetical protein
MWTPVNMLDLNPWSEYRSVAGCVTTNTVRFLSEMLFTKQAQILHKIIEVASVHRCMHAMSASRGRLGLFSLAASPG